MGAYATNLPGCMFRYGRYRASLGYIAVVSNRHSLAAQLCLVSSLARYDVLTSQCAFYPAH